MPKPRFKACWESASTEIWRTKREDRGESAAQMGNWCMGNGWSNQRWVEVGKGWLGYQDTVMMLAMSMDSCETRERDI